MYHLNRISAVRVAFGLVGSLLVLGLAVSARADTTYIYTGNPFTNLSGGITGSLTLAQALAANSNTSVQFPDLLGYANVLSWSFTDGTTTWTSSDPNPGFLATLTTNGSGDIVQWTLNTGTKIVGPNTFQWKSTETGCLILQCGDSILENGTIFAKNTAPGSWAMAPTTVPESSTSLLLFIGIAALAMVRRRLLA